MATFYTLVHDLHRGKKRADIIARHRQAFARLEGNLRVLATLEPTLEAPLKKLIALGKGKIPVRHHLGALVDLREAAQAVLRLCASLSTGRNHHGHQNH